MKTHGLSFFGYVLPLGAFLYPIIGLAQPAVDPNALIAQGVDAVVNGQWWILAGIVVSALTWFLHSPVAKRLPLSVQQVLEQPLVNYATPFVLSALAGLSSMGAAGHVDLKAWAATTVKTAAMAALTFLAAKNVAEQTGGAVPKPPAAMLVALLGAALLLARPAQAQELHVGPSLPLVQVTPGDKHPVALAPGAGVTVGVDLFPGTIFGRPAHWLTLGADVFGSLVSADAAIAGGLSIAIHAAVAEAFTIGVGAKLTTSDHVGFLDGPASFGHSWFVLFGIDGGLVNLLQLGHLGVAPVAPEVPVDGDHPNGVESEPVAPIVTPGK